MVEQDQEKSRRLLTSGELKLNERVAAAQQLARQMELAIKPDIAPETLEKLTRPGINKAGEIGWGWSYSTIAEGKPVGYVELEVQAHKDMDAIPTGDVTISISRIVYTQDDHSHAVGGPYWARTIDEDADDEDVFQEAGEKLNRAWSEVKELASKLPEIARTRKDREERLMREQGFNQAVSGWTRENSN